MKNYPNAANGLHLMFIAEVLAVVGAILMLIPIINLIGSILAIIALVMMLVGLNKAGADDQGYRTAFMLSIVNLVVSIIGAFVSTGAIGGILDIVSTILNLAVVYYVITTTSNLARSIGNEELPRKGHTVWTLYIVCAIISVICAILAMIPSLVIIAIAGIIAIIVAIIQIIAYILYMIFLSNGSKALA